jgi:tRNA1(Val) A37 N6-methylase TrmN6
MRPEPADDTTDDAALGGRLRLLQPRRGHRFGHDAMLLAAATPAAPGDFVVDLGAGVGAAGLAVAARVAGIRIALVEIEHGLSRLAALNATRNGYAEIAKIAALDVTGSANDFAKVGLAAGVANRVLMNPPFHEAGRTHPSSDEARRAAYVGGSDILPKWINTAERLLCAGGTLTLIYRADALDVVLAALAGGFGNLAVMPVYPKPEIAAIRVIVGAKKGSRKPLAVLPVLYLNDAEGHPTRQAEDVLRRAAALKLSG